MKRAAAALTGVSSNRGKSPAFSEYRITIKLISRSFIIDHCELVCQALRNVTREMKHKTRRLYEKNGARTTNLAVAITRGGKVARQDDKGKEVTATVMRKPRNNATW